MKWLLLPVLFFSFSAFAEGTSPNSNMQASGEPASVDTCKTPEGRDFKKGQPGYKNCMKRKKINRDEKKMPNVHESNDGLGMGFRDGN
jgi:hypothetical protein